MKTAVCVGIDFVSFYSVLFFFIIKMAKVIFDNWQSGIRKFVIDRIFCEKRCQRWDDWHKNSGDNWTKHETFHGSNRDFAGESSSRRNYRSGSWESNQFLFSLNLVSDPPSPVETRCSPTKLWNKTVRRDSWRNEQSLPSRSLFPDKIRLTLIRPSFFQLNFCVAWCHVVTVVRTMKRWIVRFTSSFINNV